MARTADVKAQVLQDIADGRIALGERLTIDDLAQRYESSHMPIREALRELHGSGLLQQGPGRSMQLVPFNRAMIENLFNTRSAVEVMLIRHAAQRFTKRDRLALETIEAELEAHVDRGEDALVLQVNSRFHTKINAIAENPEANAIIDRHWLFIRLLWSRVGYGPERFAGVVSDHRHLIKALSANDVEAAAVLMGAHVIKAKYELLARMDIAPAGTI